ncbi:protein serine/threonine kinase, putative [Entamoeba invadens IP1]|uniref:protein serine/threonine kinase, putative n=1 Tax=Entamoeba invadens IP1 TaxID=370355 RepID=UPI0002C3CF49|nr:protein serine/threonine kinase, putative [Entamoeba invadens IP1]ELP93256.1 protein serine/threonine kinase, putative [Entamoeba invadens IP1]|eukprot:XP_004260027.1 protein serine/threonine kinase, putative [Entamoeba invadens IP1]
MFFLFIVVVYTTALECIPYSTVCEGGYTYNAVKVNASSCSTIRVFDSFNLSCDCVLQLLSPTKFVVSRGAYVILDFEKNLTNYIEEFILEDYSSVTFQSKIDIFQFKKFKFGLHTQVTYYEYIVYMNNTIVMPPQLSSSYTKGVTFINSNVTNKSPKFAVTGTLSFYNSTFSNTVLLDLSATVILFNDSVYDFRNELKTYYDQPKISSNHMIFTGKSYGKITNFVLYNVNNITVGGRSEIIYNKEDFIEDLMFNLTLTDDSIFHIFGEYQVGSSFIEIISKSILYVEKESSLSRGTSSTTNFGFVIQENSIVHVFGSIQLFSYILGKDNASIYMDGSVSTGIFPLPINITLCGDAYLEVGGNVQLITDNLSVYDNARVVFKDYMNVKVTLFSLLELYDGMRLFLYDNSSLYFDVYDKIHASDGIYMTYMYDNSKIVFHGKNHGFLFQVELNNNSQIITNDSVDVTLAHVNLKDNSTITVSDNSKVILANLKSSYTSKIVFKSNGKMSLRCSTGEYNDVCLFEESVINLNGFPFDFTNVSLNSAPLDVFDTKLLFNDSTLENTILPTERCISLFSFGNDATVPTFTNPQFFKLFDGKLVRFCPDTMNSNMEKTYCTMTNENWDESHLFERNYPFDQAHCPYPNVEIITSLSRVVIGNYQISATFLNETNLVFSEVANAPQKVTGKLKEVTFPSGVTIKNLCSVIERVVVELLQNGTYSYTSVCKEFSSTSLTHFKISKESEMKGTLEQGYLTIDNNTFIISTNFGVLLYISNKLAPSYITTNLTFDILVIGKIGFFSSGELCKYGRVTSTISECFKYDKMRCDEGYFKNGNSCIDCVDTNCIKCTNKECVLCANNFVLNNGVCDPKPSSCQYALNNICFKCQDGYSMVGTKCLTTSPLPNCTESRNNICIQCTSTLMVIKDGICVQYEGAVLTTLISVIKCEPGYYTMNGICYKCIQTHPHCLTCDSLKCFICENGYDLKSDGMCYDQNCETYNYVDVCITCKEGYLLDESKKCMTRIDNCSLQSLYTCYLCEEGHYLLNGICVSIIANCLSNSNTGCIRCNPGYFLNSMKLCEKCQINCLTCGTSPSNCLSCHENTFLFENKCITSSKYGNLCDRYTSNGYCVHCISGYFLESDSCQMCLSSCGICSNKYYCITCKEGYFLSIYGECLNNSQVGDCAVNVSTSYGCIKCNPGNYLHDKQCFNCPFGCDSCDAMQCFSCYDEYVFINKRCIARVFISKCLSANNGTCVSCSFWYVPSTDGTFCKNAPVWWVIFLVVVWCFIVMVVAILILIFILYKIISKYIRNKKLDMLVTKMSNGNILTHELIQGVYSNVSKIIADNENSLLPVFVKTTTTFVVGNKEKHTVRLQVKGQNNKYRYLISVTPPVVLLKKNEACTFTVTIEPYCTCRIDDIVSIFINDKNKQRGERVTLPIIAESMMSSYLDQTEIVIKRMIGEGSFGKVYLGLFRGTQVALKILKQINLDQETLNEFKKEVEMLNKFRCDQIIHFFGSVRMPKIIGMVIEYAPYGSLRNNFNTKKEQVDEKIRIKILLDTSTALSYLHSNGVLHRDIKPDNVLLFDKTNIVSTNAKLSDFGSSRNINLFISNMSFTKGVGTPVYMAPEIYNKNRYSKAADIFALGITMLECMKWGDAYVGEMFTFAWQVPDFINKGNRLPKPDNVTDEMFHVIQACWDDIPQNRLTAEEVCNTLALIEQRLN